MSAAADEASMESYQSTEASDENSVNRWGAKHASTPMRSLLYVLFCLFLISAADNAATNLLTSLLPGACMHPRV